MPVPQETRERVFTAADKLYAADNTRLPTVEEVRQESHVGMGGVVQAMREWRDKQRTHAPAPRTPLPDELQAAALKTTQALWEAAQHEANTALEAVKADFEDRKRSMDELSDEQAASFEAQEKKLQEAETRAAGLEQQAAKAAAAAQEAATVLAVEREARQKAEQAAALAKQGASDTERLAAELRTELDRAHDAATHAAADSEEASKRHAAELVRVEQRADKAETEKTSLNEVLTAERGKVASIQAELDKTRVQADADAKESKRRLEQAKREFERLNQAVAKAEAERDSAREEAKLTTNEAAELRGQLQALQSQTAA